MSKYQNRSDRTKPKQWKQPKQSPSIKKDTCLNANPFTKLILSLIPNKNISWMDLPLITSAVRYGRETHVVKLMFSSHALDVDGTMVMNSTAFISITVSIEIICALCDIFITAPFGSRHYEELCYTSTVSGDWPNWVITRLWNYDLLIL